MKPALLRLEGLHFAHPGAAAPLFQALSAEWPAGIALVCGDEACGKSTLMRLLAGQLHPAKGRMLWQGRPLQAHQVAWFDAQDPARQQQVVRHILDELLPEPPAELAALLVDLGLEPHLDKPLYQLSTGSRRKVFLAAALSSGAALTLVDQPFMALDGPSIQALLARFQAWQGQAQRLLLIADHLPPPGLALSATLDLDRLR
jgi:energy-coupling factor transporter ATP-binding protein EcfA2